MVGHVVEREVETTISPTSSALSPTDQPPGSSAGETLRMSIYKQESNGSFPSKQELSDEKKLEVAVALSMLVGLFQVGSLIRAQSLSIDNSLVLCFKIFGRAVSFYLSAIEM